MEMTWSSPWRRMPRTPIDARLWNSRTSVERKRIATLALKHRQPAIGHTKEFVEAGGLLGYGDDVAASAQRAAFYVDRILRGASPADLPVERPTKFELSVNLKTAKALGLTTRARCCFERTT